MDMYEFNVISKISFDFKPQNNIKKYGFNSLNFCECVDVCRESAFRNKSLLTKRECVAYILFHPEFIGSFFFIP